MFIALLDMFNYRPICSLYVIVYNMALMGFGRMESGKHRKW